MDNYKNGVCIDTPAGCLDLEYANTAVQPDTLSKPTHGIAVICPHCNSIVQLPLDATLTAWDALLALVSSALSVPPRAVLLDDGLRPSTEVLQARACLTQALCGLMGEKAAQRWMKLHGLQAKRFRRLQRTVLHDAAATLLQQMIAP